MPESTSTLQACNDQDLKRRNSVRWRDWVRQAYGQLPSMRAASSGGGQTASSLPFMMRQHLRPVSIVWTAVPVSFSAGLDCLEFSTEGAWGCWVVLELIDCRLMIFGECSELGWVVLRKDNGSSRGYLYLDGHADSTAI